LLIDRLITKRSIAMSELYKEAAALLQKLERRQGGLKSLAYADEVVHKRSSFALVCETLRYKPLLRALLTAVPQLQPPKKLAAAGAGGAPLLYVSLYDLLFGRQKIQGGGHVKKELMKHQNALRAALVRMKIKAKVATNEDLLPEENRKHAGALPRYVRVNTLLAADDDVQGFRGEFPDAKEDAHVRDLLVLPPGTELHEHELVKSGKLILQDKASCFPAFVLHGEHCDSLGSDGDVIDACAAPGNKTSHAAMLLQQQHVQQGGEGTTTRRVFAFDRSAKRLDLLRRRMKLAGAAEIVEPCLQSFLDVDPSDDKYRNVRSILLDPSCSGSGMNNRLDHLLDIASTRQEQVTEPGMDEYEEDVANRLQSLADFQLEALLKAFSFPQVERVVYSTCSIFQKENEDVVVAALESAANREVARPFRLRSCLETWNRRGVEVSGHLGAEDARMLVRANGLEDETNGFFVAYFERNDVGVAASSAPAVKSSDSKEAEASVHLESNGDDEAARQADGAGTKRKRLSEAQRENRKKRKREKRKQKRQAA
jgi:putative methyltransferase